MKYHGNHRVVWFARSMKQVSAVIIELVDDYLPNPMPTATTDLEAMREDIAFRVLCQLRGRELATGVEIQPVPITRWSCALEHAIWETVNIVLDDILARGKS